MISPPGVEILLVQRDDESGQSLRTDFDATGLLSIVQTVPTPESALAYLRSLSQDPSATLPALILVDLECSDSDPHLAPELELLAELKSDSELRVIPVVVLTQSHVTADVLNAYSSGACSFVCKPDSPLERRRLIDRFSQYWSYVAQLPNASGRWYEESGLTATDGDEGAPLGKPIDVLVVDDSEDDVVLLQEAFSDCPLVNFMYRVEDGEAALRYLRAESPYQQARRPGLVLLDINMPRKNGFEVLSEMRTDPELRRVPVVMLTTSKQESDILRAYATGACSFISKPVNFHKMKQVARKFAIYWTAVADVPE